MKVLMDKDLCDLYYTGKSKKYKDICRNRELYAGFRTAVDVMISASGMAELEKFSFLHYENK